MVDDSFKNIREWKQEAGIGNKKGAYPCSLLYDSSMAEGTALRILRAFTGCGATNL